MRAIRVFERKYLPNIRNKQWYRFCKIIILVPILTPIYLLKVLANWALSKVRFRRKGKPDIVLKNIIDGWTNLVLPNEVTEELALKRANICATCPFAQMSGGVYTIVVDNKTKNIRGMSCGKCGCPLSAKVRSTEDVCPLGKW